MVKSVNLNIIISQYFCCSLICLFCGGLFDSKKKLCALYGKWTECLYSVDLATFEAYKKNDKKNTEEKKNNKQVLILKCNLVTVMCV